jgi:hypothetical protein
LPWGPTELAKGLRVLKSGTRHVAEARRREQQAEAARPEIVALQVQSWAASASVKAVAVSRQMEAESESQESAQRTPAVSIQPAPWLQLAE